MESAKENQQREAHVLIFPFPIQGHINTMLRLADALSFAGSFRISFLNTVHNHRLLRIFSPSKYSRFSLRPNFRFISIPDGLPDDNPRSVHQLRELGHSLRTRSLDSFRALLLAGGSQDPNGWPPVSCLIVDGLMPLAMDAALALGVPPIVFRTISASSLWVYLRFPHMIEAGELPFPADGDLDEPIKSVPAMESFLRRRDLPTMCRKATKAEDEELRFFAEVSASAIRSKGLILNTSNLLEAPVLSQMRS
ncbi:7-deoxyloganetic acid glucosyltransferase-like, partial [Phalaenopsis equestris]|uniref:7-deoxyloganetic acid glucosyltransferase-like n=1 Tax=Phalaenopsis equestris TaxID=78828 RepID=UPI0009E47C67